MNPPNPVLGEGRFADDSYAENNTWVADTRSKTSLAQSIRKTLFRIYLIGGTVATVCVLLLLVSGITVYRRMTYVDPVNPDYASLEADSDTYWTDRILIDIETAQQSPGTEQVRQQRLRRFANRTLSESLNISSPYARAQAATSIAMVLAQNDIDIVLNNQLQQLGDTYLIVSMRARALISQALMYVRVGKVPAARVALQQYNQLVNEANLKLDSTLNEESFFGAVTVLQYLGGGEELKELFRSQKASIPILGLDQQIKAYRLVAGEQVRVGMTPAALETAQRINNPIELARAWTLILQYTARPPRVLPVEPTMLDLLVDPPATPPHSPYPAEQVAHEIFQYLADNKEINDQTALLLRIAGSRLMCDRELYKIFRHCLIESEELDDRVKEPVLKLLIDPESPTIRAALGMPPRLRSEIPQVDLAVADWTTSDEPVYVEIVDIDPTPLRSRNDLQWIQALLAIAQSYQSVKRFQDADRILKRAFVVAQKFVDPTIRIQLLLRIGEQQIGIGSTADAQKTFATVAPTLNPNQQSDLARLQILARLFNDAFATISSIESPEIREYVSSFLLREQIRINRLHDAEKTLTLMPQGRAATESRSLLNVAKETASREDFNTLGLTIPEGDRQDWEQYCIGLIQQGLLRLANQAADGIRDVQKRTNARTRISREYLLLYQAFNDTNDPNRTIRHEIQQAILTVVTHTPQPAMQTAILTELLTYLTGQLITEADRTDGKKLWTQAIDSCRRITEPADEALLFAQLIVAKNILEAPNLQRLKTMPLFTQATHAQAFAETEQLIAECLKKINALEDEEQQGSVCVHLANALVQVGRIKSAQLLLDRVLEVTTHMSGYEKSVPMLLSTIPPLKAMNSADAISAIYRLAIDDVCGQFANTTTTTNIDILDWRMRDSDIEQIVRSQMEHGFLDDAVESAMRLNEPVLRDRLLRIAAYIFLDHENIDRAELEARRMAVKEIQDPVLQNIQIIKRRSTPRTLPNEIADE